MILLSEAHAELKHLYAVWNFLCRLTHRFPIPQNPLDGRDGHNKNAVGDSAVSPEADAIACGRILSSTSAPLQTAVENNTIVGVTRKSNRTDV